MGSAQLLHQEQRVYITEALSELTYREAALWHPKCNVLELFMRALWVFLRDFFVLFLALFWFPPRVPENPRIPVGT